MDKVITISRQFGSGGREFGIKLAEALNIPFYDKELISLAAKDSSMCEEFLQHHEESAPNVLSGIFYSAYFMPMSDQIYIAQSNAIKELAKRGPCVILGRCADAILDDSIKIYIHADLAKRVQRKNSLNLGVAPEKMEAHVKSIDKKRKKYYEFYTYQKWGMAENHDLCLDSGLIGVDGCVETTLTFLKNIDNGNIKLEAPVLPEHKEKYGLH